MRDAETWTRFVNVFGPVVFRWCKQSGLQDEVAADVGQEVFRAVIGGIQKFDHRPEDSLIRWLRRITQNKVAEDKPIPGQDLQGVDEDEWD